MDRLYRYVGPEEIRKRLARQPPGGEVAAPSDVIRWASMTGQASRKGETIPATFVIEPGKRLLIADRRSEHVACAAGSDVLAAGELFFAIDRQDVWVEEASNQSTGYCPEPQSWEAVRRVLDRVGLAHPDGFTTVCVFRRCTQCGERNIVKDAWFRCGTCGAKLDPQWNFDR